MDDTVVQLALTAALTHFIERMKWSEDPWLKWITPHGNTAPKVVTAVVAALAAVGLTFTWVVDPVTMHGTLTMTGIPTTQSDIIEFFSHIFTNYMGGKGYYLTAIKPHVAGVMTRGTGTGDPDSVATQP